MPIVMRHWDVPFAPVQLDTVEIHYHIVDEVNALITQNVLDICRAEMAIVLIHVLIHVV